MIFLAIMAYRITMAIERINSLSDRQLQTLLSIDNSLIELNDSLYEVEVE